MRIVLLGAPGSGKGTQGAMLAMELRIPKLSTGDTLREAVAAGTPAGLKAQAAMNAGQLVSDDVVIDIVRGRVSESDAAGGFILDGFPRNIAQAQVLDTLLAQLAIPPIDKVIHLQVDDQEIIGRLLERGRQLGRSDDNEETITRRISVYGAETRPLLAYYRAQSKLVTVAGDGDIPHIYGRLTAALGGADVDSAVA